LSEEIHLDAKSARGLAHSRTLARVMEPGNIRQVLDCGSPLPLSTGSNFGMTLIIETFLFIAIPGSLRACNKYPDAIRS
jgi:hypothetical protein